MTTPCACGFSPADEHLTAAVIECERFVLHVNARITFALREAVEKMNREEDEILLYGAGEPGR